MVIVLDGRERGRYSTLFDSLFRLRYEVFIKFRGWSLPAVGDREIDQYDIDDSVYFLDLDEQGGIQGSVRITPTLKGSLLADYFPHLVESGDSPRSPDVYEATRYIVLPAVKSRSANRLAKARLLSSMFEWALERKISFIQSIIDTSAVSNFVEMTPQMKPLGLSYPYGGGREAPGGGECIAFRWPLSLQLIHDVRQYGGLDEESKQIATASQYHAELLQSVH